MIYGLSQSYPYSLVLDFTMIFTLIFFYIKNGKLKIIQCELSGKRSENFAWDTDPRQTNGQ